MKNLILVLLFSVVQNTFANSNLQTGDLIFHISTSSQSLAIQKATHSPYSHMGLIVNKHNQIWVLEATQPVKYTTFQQWIQRGENQHYVVKRYIVDLTGQQKNKLLQNAEQYLNRPYDIYFSWDNQAIYCSELVWKAYDDALHIQLAPLEKLRQFNLNDPVVQKLMRQRYGTQIPFNENVISPKAIYESKLLREVMRK